ncbi:MAG TPA: tRNA (N6-threonylcarbamoyladenosine(37)-N6)-methyltransferase TrmO [Syntrophales bacterium]|jgi:tRNA-Thr(GGU) m(6)t(6)A37 methyltransferase TsaA|nr:tRNA (N6-threonylcarbamoyladenosine(37)-N6)-methyltransferase TrmO [Syntrophales bacterium]HOX93786.1 tRNA (N6-threonylcarbamoyladenosine(37)-N6)-methyltransferase TrmO [Syntrophales bacterium]HPI56142.1 tRNA (N6-threonylcarbamoyladenosine(37)-N6)-methyltransferase TrmO [Syntrophales bacterium]HPN23968.1 tRNA (N6-threonylcarbamoyladenosine(37)-N6)-methyltransferase TrmO [Syntrophales bacterium]HQM28247.1 tRNA (N6-threonylcarbamoyladenosine(37)-N6)-methyltransferase TrmO [Syntrophales bacteri
MDSVQYKPIGIIYSPFDVPEGTPIQPAGARGVAGRVEVFPEYVEGLKDVEGFSHILLIYHFHLSRKSSLTVKPYLDSHLRGVFATRSPSRPNPIGISVVRLNRVEGAILHILDIDVVNGTPLLDVKPYVPAFDVDVSDPVKIGWLEGLVGKASTVKDDGRFKR